MTLPTRMTINLLGNVFMNESLAPPPQGEGRAGVPSSIHRGGATGDTLWVWSGHIRDTTKNQLKHSY